MFPRTPSNVLTALLLGIIALAPIRASLFQPSSDSVVHAAGADRNVTGDIVNMMRDVDKATITLAHVTVDDVAHDDHILVTVPLFPRLLLGSRVSLSCDLERPEPFDGFPYDRYLAIRGIFAVCETRDVPFLISEESDTSLMTKLTALREALMLRIGRVFPEPGATLLSGLLIGEARFSSAWKERFRATGTSHVVAASGYNVAVVTIIVFSAFTWIGIRRQRAFPVMLAALALYALLAGLSPPVVRAAVMGGLVLLARNIGRKTSMRNMFLLAVAGMVTAEPLLVVADIGFGLSVFSTVALLWFAPLLNSRFDFLPVAFGIREAFVASLAATLVSLPLVILVFGSVPLVSPLVNLLILPFVPFAMGFGVVGVVFGPIAGLPAIAVLRVILEVIRAIAETGLVLSIPLSLRLILSLFIGLSVFFLWRKFSRSRSSFSPSLGRGLS